ncbi:MAG: undecaprenyl-phosphate glucose phosphotransferase [Chloroflexi bacterium]|nr:undecaprenyl-phosphate glucose phosphotransferase [Chloroflexota bacterium]
MDLFYSILAAVSVASIVATASSFLTFRSNRGDLARGMILYHWVLSVVLITLGRTVTGWIQQQVRRRQPDALLIVGTGEVARMVLQKTIQSPQLGYKVVGFVDGNGDGDGTGQEVAGVPVLGSRGDLARIVREQGAREVVIALPEATHEQLLEMISACESERATVRIFPDLFQIVASELTISDLDGLPLLTVRDVALRGWKLAVKRVMDLVISGVGLVFLSPFLLLVALLIKLESRGPVFYTQVRVGLDGKPFHMIKFRSMRTDAEDESGPVWATPDDPRRTRLGAFLRKTSIDELPQLINVLLGEMSVVGPRPERPVFVEQFRRVVPRYMERHYEKAGLTGWAQVNGLRGDTSIIERTKYDLYYIENWSLLFDIKIILRTLVNAIRGDRNAY